MVQRSIDKLSLGMTRAQVRGAYGKPEAVRLYSESETGKPIESWLYRKRRITAEFRQVNNTRFSLAGIYATSARERTLTDAGVGSSETALKRAVPGLYCAPADPGQTWCTLGNGDQGTPQTVFVLRRRKTTEVRVLIVFP